MWKGNFKNKMTKCLLNVGQAMPDNLNYSNERLFISYLSSKLHQSKL